VKVFVIRHGETAWSLSGQHTGTTDLRLTDNGRRRAEMLRPVLAKETFGLVLVSPMQRVRQTCELAGLGHSAVIDPDLSEWDYGQYEGLTTPQIHEKALDRLLGCRWRAFSARYGHFVRARLLPRCARRRGVE
jgi:broad specificity phosphatase PhoE